MTNVAMADALASLDHVEGVGEVFQPQSARKTEAGSPEVPRTATRTSTRAKKLALESTGTVSLSGARTRKKLVDDDAVEEEKKEAGKTPAVASSRKRAPAAASQKKMEVPPMQKVYRTRSSVRLIENKLSEMCLGESGKRNQPIKIDDELSSEMTESEIKAESEMCEEKALDSDEVKYCQVSDQLVEAVDIADVIQVNEASNKDHKGVVVTEEVKKTTEEVFAEEAVGAMGDYYVEKDLKIVSDDASSLDTSAVSAQPVEAADSTDVVQFNEVSNNVKTGVVVTEEVEKAIEEDSAEEAVGAMGDADVEKDLKIVSDGASSLGTSEVSAQPVEAVDSTGVDQVNEVSNNTAGEVVVTGEVENAITEDYAGKAVGAKGSADAGKDLKITNDGVSSLGTSAVSAQLVEVVDSTIQVNEVSSYGITDIVATEEGKKAASEDFADEPVEAMGTADAVKDLELASDCVSGLVAVEMIGKASPKKFAEKAFAVAEVASRLGSPEMVEIAAGEELEIASEVAVTDLQVKEDVELKSLADHENEDARNIFVDLVTNVEDGLKSPADHEMTKTAADLHDFDVPAAAEGAEQNVELHIAGHEPGILSTTKYVIVAKADSETTFQVDECNQDVDSMTCQMGSLYHLTGLVEDLADDLNPQDSTYSEEQMEDVECGVDNQVSLLDFCEPKPVTSDDLNLQDSTYAEEHTEDVECGVDEKETFECSVPKPVTFEVKPASEERIKMSPFSARIANLGNTPYPKPQTSLQRSVFKEALAIDYVNKENMVVNSLVTEESIKKPEMNYDVMSMRQLRKMVKAMSISTPGDIEEDDNTTKDTVKQHTVRPRHALKRLPDYTQI